MAHRHGLAGKYGKSETAKRFFRIFFTLVTVGVFGTWVTGFAEGYFWGKYGAVWACTSMIVAFGLFAIAWRYANKYTDKLIRERIYHTRGLRGEVLIAWILEDFDNNWHIFNGLKLTADSDIDHILVGPGGLFCISTKSQRGLFTGTVDGLLYNGRTSDFARQALRQTMDLKDRLVAMMGQEVPWVQSVLAIPSAYTEGDAFGGRVWLVNQETIRDRLVPENEPKKISKHQLDRTIKVLELIEASLTSSKSHAQ